MQQQHSTLVRLTKCSPPHLSHAYDIDAALERRELKIKKEEQRLHKEARKIQLLRLQAQRDIKQIRKEKRELRELSLRFGCLVLPDE